MKKHQNIIVQYRKCNKNPIGDMHLNFSLNNNHKIKFKYFQFYHLFLFLLKRK